MDTCLDMYTARRRPSTVVNALPCRNQNCHARHGQPSHRARHGRPSHRAAWWRWPARSRWRARQMADDAAGGACDGLTRLRSPYRQPVTHGSRITFQRTNTHTYHSYMRVQAHSYGPCGVRLVGVLTTRRCGARSVGTATMAWWLRRQAPCTMPQLLHAHCSLHAHIRHMDARMHQRMHAPALQ